MFLLSPEDLNNSLKTNIETNHNLSNFNKIKNNSDYKLLEKANEYYKNKDFKKALNIYTILSSSENDEIIEIFYRIGCIFLNKDFSDYNLEYSLYWLKKSAEYNHLNSLYKIGVIYLEKKDFHESYNWLNRASTLGSIKATYKISFFYRDGFVVNKNVNYYIKLLNVAAKNNFFLAFVELAEYYYHLLRDSIQLQNIQNNINEESDIKKSQKKKNKNIIFNENQLNKWTDKIIEYESDEEIEEIKFYKMRAIKNIAFYYLNNYKINRAKEYFEKGINYNDDECYFQLGEICFKKKNLKESLCYYEESIKYGNIKAYFKLGKINYILKDYEKAFKYLFQGIKKNNIYCYHHLGLLYEYGLSVEKNYEIAFKWYNEGLEKGDEAVYYKLGYFYENGLYVERNYEKAIEYYLKSINLNATFRIGIIYEKQFGDFYKALEYYVESAHDGNKKAIHKIIDMYRFGIGIPINQKVANEWQDKLNNIN